MITVIEGIILGLSIAAPIGPTNIEIIRRGLKNGWKSAASFYLGVLVALSTYLIFALIGLSYLTKIPIFNLLLLVFGVLVLFYLSYNSIKDFFSKKNFIPGIVLTISNPYVLLFWTGIMGADIVSNSASINRSLLLSLGILIGVIIFAFIIIPAVQFGRKYVNQKNFRYVSLASGLILFYFFIKFGIELVKLILSM